MLEPFRNQWAVVDVDCKHSKYNTAFLPFSDPTKCPSGVVENVPQSDVFTNGWHDFCADCPMGCVAVLAQKAFCQTLDFFSVVEPADNFIDANADSKQICDYKTGSLPTSELGIVNNQFL